MIYRLLGNGSHMILPFTSFLLKLTDLLILPFIIISSE